MLDVFSKIYIVVCVDASCEISQEYLKGWEELIVRRQQVQRQRRFGDLKSESGIYHLSAVKVVLVNDP